MFSLDRCFVIEDATMCSRVLQRIQVRDMGLYLAGLKRSPFLNMITCWCI